VAKKTEKEAKAKPKKGGAKGGAPAPAGEPLPSVAAHPRAGGQIARAKAWGGLGGFALTAYLSYGAGVPIPELLLRAIAGGIVGWLVLWGVAVTVWRHLVIAELRAVRVARAAEAERRAAAQARQPAS
jgi:hypothetical protein